MSKSIQIVSTNIGIVSLSVKGESRVINFKPVDRDGKTVGVAMCDHDEASVLLRIQKDFWKPGQSADDVQSVLDKAAAVGKKVKEDAIADLAKVGSDSPKEHEAGPTGQELLLDNADKDSEAGNQEAAYLGAKTEPALSDEEQATIATIVALDNYNAFKAAIKKCQSLEVIKRIMATELSKEDPKDNRLDLLNGRMTELQG